MNAMCGIKPCVALLITPLQGYLMPPLQGYLMPPLQGYLITPLQGYLIHQIPRAMPRASHDMTPPGRHESYATHGDSTLWVQAPGME
jgi:hypothetical protein